MELLLTSSWPLPTIATRTALDFDRDILMDFTVKRRRKRPAVDPCLGYYEDALELPFVNSYTAQDEAGPSQRNEADVPPVHDSELKTMSQTPLPRWSEPPHTSARRLQTAVQPNQSDPEAGSQVTVNGFLSGIGIQHPRQRKKYSSKKSTLEAPTFFNSLGKLIDEGPIQDGQHALNTWDLSLIRVGSSDQEGNIGTRSSPSLEISSMPASRDDSLHLRNRAVRRVILSDSAYDSSSSSDCEHDCPPPTNQVTPKIRKKSRKTSSRQRILRKSLGTRLFEASVLTNGQPLDSLVLTPAAHNEEESGKLPKPLRFVPLQTDDLEREDNTLVRRATLVDPRKASPFLNAAFCSTSQLQFHIRHGPEESKDYAKVSSWKSRVVRASEEYSESVQPPSENSRSYASQAAERVRGAAIRTFTRREDYPALEMVHLDGIAATQRDMKEKERK